MINVEIKKGGGERKKRMLGKNKHKPIGNGTNYNCQGCGTDVGKPGSYSGLTYSVFGSHRMS